MMIDLVWIVAAYAAAAYCVHWRIARMSKESAGGRHFVLVAGNHQMQIEGYIRKLRGFSRKSGADIGITVVLDPSSSDETGKIASILASREEGQIAVVRAGADDSRGYGAENGGRADARLLVPGIADARLLVPGIPADKRLVWVDLSDEEHVRALPK